MALSKLWLFLVTLVGAAAVAVLLVAPRSLDDELARETGARLERAQQAASLLFQVNGRRWIDSAAQAASDAVLVESLSEASRGPADLVIVHRTVQDRLKHFGGQLHAELALATDAKGRVIARLGPDDAVWKDGVEGLPLVADALRGLRGDDTWAVDGRVYRVVATPVMTKERYVGALVIGQELGGQLVQSMKQALGTDVAVLLRGRVVASSAQSAAISQLPVIAEREAESLRTRGHTAAVPVGGDDPALAALAVLPGDLGPRALIAVIAPRTHVGAPLALAERALREVGTLPPTLLAAIGGGALLALVLGLLLLRLEVERPQRRLAADAQRLARGESQRLDDDLHPGRLGAVARAVNTALDRLGVRAIPARNPPSSEASSAASPPPPAAPPRRPQPGETSTLSAADIEARKQLLVETGAYAVMPDDMKPPLAGASIVQAVGDVGTDAVPTSVRDADAFAAPPTVQATHAPSFDDAIDAPTRARAGLPSLAAKSAAGGAEREMIAEPAFRDDEEATSVASQEALQRLAQADYAAARAAEQAAALKQRPPTIPPISTMPPLPAGTSPRASSPGIPVAAAAGPGAVASAPADADEAELRRVYQEFVETKQRLGEPTEGVTFEKFAAKLRNNRAELINRFSCKSVRFQVYVKDGKAALKATPVT
jgi:hypothetical protein